MKLSITIPTHNEEYRLSPVFQAYAECFSERMGAEAESLMGANTFSEAAVEVAEAATKPCATMWPPSLNTPPRPKEKYSIAIGTK